MGARPRAAANVLLLAAASIACAGGTAPEPSANAAAAAGPGSELAPSAPHAAPAHDTPAPADILMPAPDVTGIVLRNQRDEPVTFASLRGKPALLTFIYTRCPMPEMCPATTLRFQEVQDALSHEDRARVRLISVSFDPAHDTPAVLAEYAELWDIDESFWVLLTGADDDVRRLADAHGTWYERGDDGNFRHPMYSMVLAPDGALHRVLLGAVWDAKEIAVLLRQMAGAPGT